MQNTGVNYQGFQETGQRFVTDVKDFWSVNFVLTCTTRQVKTGFGLYAVYSAGNLLTP